MRFLVIAVALTLSLPSAASDVEEAKLMFQRGTASYDAGNFQEALEAFEAARAKKPLPGFLFNIGQCHRRLGHHADAVRFFEQYLADAPAAKNRAEVEDLLVEERAAVAAEAPAPEPAAAEAAPAAAPEPLVAEAAPAPPAAVDDGGTWMWAAIGGGALVVAAGTVAAIALLPAPSKASLGRVDLRGAP